MLKDRIEKVFFMLSSMCSCKLILNFALFNQLYSFNEPTRLFGLQFRESFSNLHEAQVVMGSEFRVASAHIGITDLTLAWNIRPL